MPRSLGRGATIVDGDIMTSISNLYLLVRRLMRATVIFIGILLGSMQAGYAEFTWKEFVGPQTSQPESGYITSMWAAYYLFHKEYKSSISTRDAFYDAFDLKDMIWSQCQRTGDNSSSRITDCMAALAVYARGLAEYSLLWSHTKKQWEAEHANLAGLPEDVAISNDNHFAVTGKQVADYVGAKLQGVKGERGSDGPRGYSGADGRDGKDGKDGRDGKDAFILSRDGSTLLLGADDHEKQVQRIDLSGGGSNARVLEQVANGTKSHDAVNFSQLEAIQKQLATVEQVAKDAAEKASRPHAMNQHFEMDISDATKGGAVVVHEFHLLKFNEIEPILRATLVTQNGASMDTPANAQSGNAKIKMVNQEVVLEYTAPAIDFEGGVRYWYTLTNKFGESLPAPIGISISRNVRAEDHAKVIVSVGKSLPRPINLFDGAAGQPNLAKIISVPPSTVGKVSLDEKTGILDFHASDNAPVGPASVEYVLFHDRKASDIASIPISIVPK